MVYKIIQFVILGSSVACLTFFQGSRASGTVGIERVEYFNDLDAIVGDYAECGVHLVLMSPYSQLAQVSTLPVTVQTYIEWKSFGIHANNPTQKLHFCVAIFILFPTKYFHSLRINVVSSSPTVHINVIFETCDWCPREFKIWDGFRLMTSKRLNFYKVDSGNTSNLEYYSVSKIYIEVPDPFPIGNFTKSNFLELRNCVISGHFQCRKKIEFEREEFHKTGFVATVITGTTKDRFKTSYFVPNVSSLVESNFIPLNNLIRKRLNHPFRWHKLSFDLIMRLLMLEGFHAWVYLKNIKNDDDVTAVIRISKKSNIIESLLWTDPVYGRLSNIQNLDKMRYLFEGKVFKRIDYLTVVPTGSTYMNFITCDGVTQPLSFYFYLEPYDLYIWIGITVLTFVILPVTVLVFFKLTLLPKPLLNPMKLALHVVEFNITLLFEIPNLPKAFEKLPHLFKSSIFILGIWSLMSVFVVNIYKGIMTTKLTSKGTVYRTHVNVSHTAANFVFYYDYITFLPLFYGVILAKLYPKYGYKVVSVDNFRGCLCFPDVSEIIPRICSLSGFGCAGRRPTCSLNHTCEKLALNLKSMNISISVPPTSTFCHYNPYGGDEIIHHYRKTKVFDRNKSGYITCDHIFAVDYDDNFFDVKGLSPISFVKSILMPLSAVSKNKFEEIHRIISSCKQTGYIDYEFDLNTFTLFAQNELQTTYRKGEERFFYNWEGYIITHIKPSTTIAARRLLELTEYGIHQIWKKWYEDQQPTYTRQVFKSELKRSKTNFQSLSLNTNVRTIFYIYVALNLLAILIRIVQMLISYIFTFLTVVLLALPY